MPYHGAISEPLAIGVYAVKKSGEIKDKSIAILGFGPIGMSVMLSARAMGANRVFVTDKIDARLRIAAKEGAEKTLNPTQIDIVAEIMKGVPPGIDIVFECCGQQEAVDQAIELLKPGGQLIVVGIPEFDRWSVDVDKTRRKEILIQFVRRQVGCVQPSIDLMGSAKIDIGKMITHRFPFSKTNEAFDLVSSYSDGVMKAMIVF